jgi:cytochrome c biogenesis protein CcmG/thiol:disulfide interchange protein DsbE
MTPIQRRVFLLAPLGVAAVGGAAFWTLLGRMRAGSYDPHGVPSMLIGKPLPSFSLPGQQPSQGFASTDIIAGGRPVLINFFASWCIPCVQEAPVLMVLKEQGLPLWGIAYKDKADATTDFLHQNGDPYTRVARDEPGRVAIDFGVYGVPESYLVDKAGIVRWRWAGGLSEDVVQQSLTPLLQSMA